MIVRIYTLQSTRDESLIRYVGKTKQTLMRRLTEHRYCAKKGEKRHVYNWIRKEWQDGYEITIKEIDSVDTTCDKDWQKLEKYWIAKFKKEGVNLTNESEGGEGTNDPEVIAKRAALITGKHRSEETKQKISIANSKPKTGEAKQAIKVAMTKKFGVRVKQYDKQGNLLKIWDSITLAAESCGSTKQAISKCCNPNDRHKTAAGYIWKYVEEEYIPDDSQNVIQMNKDYEYINEYISSKKAALEIFKTDEKYYTESITKCCHNQLKSFKGYVFVTKEAFINNTYNQYNLVKTQSVLQYDLSENFIAEYKSSKAAEQATGFAHKGILECCRGKRNSYKNFVWKFK